MFVKFQIFNLQEILYNLTFLQFLQCNINYDNICINGLGCYKRPCLPFDITFIDSKIFNEAKTGNLAIFYLIGQFF